MRLCLVFILILLSQQLYPQEKKKINIAYLSQHWIQSEKECSGDTLVFRPEGHEKLADAPLFLVYGGWTFFPEGQVHKHRWKKCGNDTEPDYRSGTWKKKGNIIKIKVAGEQFLFEILELEKDYFKVIIIPAK